MDELFAFFFAGSQSSAIIQVCLALSLSHYPEERTKLRTMFKEAIVDPVREKNPEAPINFAEILTVERLEKLDFYSKYMEEALRLVPAVNTSTYA